MPWTRLHATKDYYFMAALLKKYPEVHAVFNYSPSLLVQLEDYIKNYANMLKNEKFLSISDKKITELSSEDKLFIIQGFFPACSSSNKFIEKSAMFSRFYERLKNAGTEALVEEKIKLFDSQDYLDIIVLFNLLWFDPISIESDDFLTVLKSKDKKFTEEEKNKLIREKIPEILNKIFPAIKSLSEAGQIELSASPYYHPILPLLCDTDIAGFHDGINIPKPFRHPEDAAYQIKSSLDYFGKQFGYKVKGMWPSEGSVSEMALKLFLDNGVSWVATDEEILSNSIGVNLSDLNSRKILYRPYVIQRGGRYLYIFFRDKALSDSIGFKYSNYEPKAAAADLINNLKNMALSLQNYDKNGLAVVPIILDGENAWEYYKNNGYDFFNFLYGGLSNNTDILKTVTFSEYIEKIGSAYENRDKTNLNDREAHAGQKFSDIKWNQDPFSSDFDLSKIYNIPMIYPGSWINHNFRIWIGDREDNKAWNLLSQTRDYLILQIQKNKNNKKSTDGLNAENIGSAGNAGLAGMDFKAALEQIYIAEGSDYNWWYGEDRTSGIDEKYDQLYRTHLINVYKFLNDNPPDEYYIPLIEEKMAVKPNLAIVSYIYPDIDGIADNYFEWLGSAVYFPSLLSGKAMAHTDRFIRKIQYGFNESAFFIRFDFLSDKNRSELPGKVIILKFTNPANIELKLEFNIDNSLNILLNYFAVNKAANKKNETRNISSSNGSDNVYGMHSDIKAAYKKIIEVSIPISALRVQPNNFLDFYAVLTYKDNLLAEIERFPVNGYFETVIPDKNFEIINWLV